MFERFTQGARRVVTLGQEAARELRHDHIGTELGADEDGLRADVAAEQARRQPVDPEPPRAPTGEPMDYARFTERARTVVVLSQEAARELRHDHIGTEHLLLGLLDEQRGLAAHTLLAHGISAAQAREETKLLVGVGETEPDGVRLPYSRCVKHALEHSLRESVGLGHNYIGTEHLLLGLLQVEDSVAVRMLAGLGAPPEMLREHVIATLRGRSPATFAERALGRACELQRVEGDADSLSLLLAIVELNEDEALGELLASMLLDEEELRELPSAVHGRSGEPAAVAVERACERFGVEEPDAAQLIVGVVLGPSEAVGRALWHLALTPTEVAAQVSEWRMRGADPSASTARIFGFTMLNLLLTLTTSALVVTTVLRDGPWWKMLLLFPVWWGHPQCGPLVGLGVAGVLAWLVAPIVGAVHVAALVAEHLQADAERRLLWTRTGLRPTLREQRRVIRRFHRHARLYQQLRQTVVASIRTSSASGS